MNWITWLRGFSIRSRLIACMALVVVIGSIVGIGMSWRLVALNGEFDGFAHEEFTATQRMADLALNLSKLRGQEKAAVINTGDSVTVEGHVKAWAAALAETGKATDALIAAAPNDEIRQSATSLKEKLAAYSQALRPTLDLISSNALSTSGEAYQSTEGARQEADQADAIAV